MSESDDVEPGPLGVIESVESAVQAAKVCAPGSNPSNEVEHKSYVIERMTREIWPLQAIGLGNSQKPFEIPSEVWFRGEGNIRYKTVPNILRPNDENLNSRKLLSGSERKIFLEFQLRHPRYRADHQSTVEWLSLMQHYNMPTRLLDWSENVLSALYFAVNDVESDRETGEDGCLLVLNATLMNRLNAIPLKGDSHPENHFRVFSPSSFNVVARSLFARYEGIDDIINSRELNWFGDGDGPGAANEEFFKNAIDVGGNLEPHKSSEYTINLEEALAKPVAFFPQRANDRLIAQSGTFTIHGARLEGDHPGEDAWNLKRDPKCVRYYCIPVDKKREILRDLKSIGIHEGTIFPEMDKMATYLKHKYGFLRS